MKAWIGGPLVGFSSTCVQESSFSFERPRRFQCHCNKEYSTPGAQTAFQAAIAGTQWGCWSACVLQSVKIGSARQESGSTLGMKVLDGRSKARQREISVPDLVNKAYNCSCFFASLWLKCFCRVFQSDARSEWRGNCQGEGKVPSEGFEEDVAHTSRVYKQPPALRSEKLESLLQACVNKCFYSLCSRQKRPRWPLQVAVS